MRFIVSLMFAKLTRSYPCRRQAKRNPSPKKGVRNYERRGNMTDACKDIKIGSSLGDPMANGILKDNPGICN